MKTDNLKKRLDGKVAIIVGAGQQPGETPGNGKATAIRFAQEGATLLLVDINEAWVNDTLEAVKGYGGQASILIADVIKEENCQAIAKDGGDLTLQFQEQHLHSVPPRQW